MGHKKIMIAGEKYTNREGQEKTTWHEVGVIMTSQAGKEFVLLDPKVCLAGFPREPGKDKIIASIFEDTQQQGQQGGYRQQSPTQNQQAAVPDMGITEGNIPFKYLEVV